MTAQNPSVDGLLLHARKRSDTARRKIEKALRELRRTEATININAVARKAGVTRQTIYRHADLLEQIQTHSRIAVTPPVPEPAADGPGSIVAALRNTLAAKDKQISDLKRELRERDQAIATLHGEIERLTGGRAR